MQEAEVLFEGQRSKGAGVVQFADVAEAETAIGAPRFFTSLALTLTISQRSSWATSTAGVLSVRSMRWHCDPSNS